MTLALQRTSEQRAALDHLLRELQDPASPNFHKWLTPDEFGGRFGVSNENLTRVADWLQSEGFTVNALARGRGWIDFSGTVAQVQKAFHTEIHRFRIGKEAHIAPASPPSIPAELEHLIAGIRGLDDFYMKRSKRLQPMFTGSDGTHALAPGDIARIYNFFLGRPGGRTIAVIGESAVNLADIRQFRSTFQLSPNDPQLLLAGVDPGVVSGDVLLEADADLEWAGSASPNSTILYAYATDVVVAAQKVIDENLAPILTFSFGTCEAGTSQSDARFIQDLAQQANAQGITWVASSGDAGAAACDQGSYPATQGLSVSLPASLPEVTAVGGTEFNESNSAWNSVNSLDQSSAFGPLPEIAWNDTSSTIGLAASGGGASVLYPKPWWQRAPGVPDDGARDVPDISLSASFNHDPYIVFSGGKTYAAGGTSLSAPVFAGMVAAVIVGGVGTASGGLGNINPSLYRTASFPSGMSGAPFHDITSGNNFVLCAAGTKDCANGSLGYAAGPGYDLVTGLGSVNASYFQNTVFLVTVTTLSASTTQVTEGTPVALTGTVRTYNGVILAGYVGFQESNGLALGSALLDASGTFSGTLLLRRGTHSITAAYGANSGFTSSTSAPVTVLVVSGAPPAPALTAPSNNAADISVSVSLTWDAVPFVTSYDVYFGTSPSPPFWGNVGAGRQYTPGALAPGTKYYWKVTANNESGSTASPIWSFTTTSTVYTISMIAGSSSTGFTPDGFPAAGAQFSNPVDVAIDRTGNLYVAEAGNGRIRMINSAGIMSTFAGGGSGPECGGDGGPATAARLYPAGITIDRQGNLYIAESTPSDLTCIRKVTPAGIITTIAGGTNRGYSGDGGPAIKAQLNNPTGLAVDSQGTLYVADTGNSCIRKIAGGVITTVAGSPTNSGFSLGAPVGDGGPATSANLYAYGVAVD
ncbi:MAG TPA: protease pro-enzyme activation domain-containing protein, partial [Candidatus Solibacter sp.]|nr:protease pro-enzyme activation domain-containing protein [Candidatus Solibacter sp.]